MLLLRRAPASFNAARNPSDLPRHLTVGRSRNRDARWRDSTADPRVPGVCHHERRGSGDLVPGLWCIGAPADRLSRYCIGRRAPYASSSSKSSTAATGCHPERISLKIC
jgi:hypothetical protein